MLKDLAKIPKIRSKIYNLIPHDYNELSLTPISKNSNGIFNSELASLVVKNQNQDNCPDVTESSYDQDIAQNIVNRDIVFEGKDRPESELNYSMRNERLNKSLVFIKSVKSFKENTEKKNQNFSYKIDQEELEQIKNLDLRSINEIKKILNRAKT